MKKQSEPKPGKTFSLSVNRAEFCRAMNRVSRCVGRRTTVPILSNVELVVANGKLVLTCTDLDNEIRIELDAAGEGAICVPAYRLRDMLKAMPVVEMISMSGDGVRSVTLSIPGIEATFYTLPAEDFPVMPVDKPLWTVTLPDAVPAWLIGGPAEVMCTEETHYYLNGVCFEIKDGTAIATATDGHRLISRSTKLDGRVPDVAPIIIPTAAVKHVLALIGRGNAVLSGLSKGNAGTAEYLEVIGGGARLRIRPIDGTFPDWRRVVPTEIGSTFEIVIADLKGALALSKANARDGGSAVRISTTDDGIRLENTNPDCGKMSASVPCRRFGIVPEFGINVSYLDHMVSTVKRMGSKTVRLQVTGPNDPVMVMPDAEIIGSTAVLMPMRI